MIRLVRVPTALLLLATPFLSGCDDATAIQFDLTPPLDMAVPLDLSKQPDLTVTPDLVSLPDLIPQCPGTGTVDQSQPLANAGVRILGTDVLGQDFIVGRTGRLDGVDVLVCAAQKAKPGSVTVSVYRGNTKLSSAAIAIANLTCAGNALTHFALPCASVTMGETLRLELTSTVPNDTCVGGAMCAASTAPCVVDSTCAVIYSESAAGTMPAYTVNGTPFAGQGALAYKTLVE